MTRGLPFCPDKKLHLVFAGMPLVRRRFPFGRTAATAARLPRFGGVKKDQFPVAEPQHREWCAIRHVCVDKTGIHAGERVAPLKAIADRIHAI